MRDLVQCRSQFHDECRRKVAALKEALVGLLPLRERVLMSDAHDAPLKSDVNVQDWLNRMRQRRLGAEPDRDPICLGH